MATARPGAAHVGQAEAILNANIQRFLLTDSEYSGECLLTVPEDSKFLAVSPDRYWAYYAVPSEPTGRNQPEYFLLLKIGDPVDLNRYHFVGHSCGLLVFKA